MTWALAAALRSQAARVLVVTGRLPLGTRRLVMTTAHRSGHQIQVVHARHYRRGMGWSLATAAHTMPADATGFLVCPGDMAALDPAWLDHVLGHRGQATVAVRPVLPGQPAHPAWISRALFGEAGRLRGDDGLKSLLATHREVCHLPVPARFVRAATTDVDTPRQLRRLARGPDPRRRASGTRFSGKITGPARAR